MNDMREKLCLLNNLLKSYQSFKTRKPEEVTKQMKKLFDDLENTRNDEEIMLSLAEIGNGK